MHKHDVIANTSFHIKNSHKNCVSSTSRHLILKHLQQSIKNVSTFRLHVKLASSSKRNSKCQTRAIHVECALSDTQKVHHILSRAYQSQTLPGQFIPLNLSHLRFDQAYVKWIEQQNTYLDTHRNCLIKNISCQQMREHKVDHEGKQHLLHSVLAASPLIKNVSPTAKTDSEGLWNMSTTSELYNDAVLFVNSILGTNNNSPPSNSTINELDNYHSFLCQSTITLESNSFYRSSQESNESPPRIP